MDSQQTALQMRAAEDDAERHIMRNYPYMELIACFVISFYHVEAGYQLLHVEAVSTYVRS